MRHTLVPTLLLLTLLPGVAPAQDAKAVLDSVAKAMGSAELTSLQYTGSGTNFALGQNAAPGAPWPRFNVKSFKRLVNYSTVSMHDEIVRTQAEPTPRGGGGQPLSGEQRQMFFVSGTHAWNQTGNNMVAAPVALPERLQQLWITPHGVIKAAMAHQVTAQTQTAGDRKLTTLAFTVPGALKIQATINERHLVEKVTSWSPHHVLGDMLTETTYTEYKDFGGLQFPTRIVQTQGGFPSLDLTVQEVQANAPADITVPDDVRQASIKVEANKVAEGVWYLTGGTHHSVVVEMQDHVVVIEGPQDDARASAVLAETKKLLPSKPIKYVVNTHHHFDHAGGLGAFAADGITIITHDVNKAFLAQSLAAPRTVQPDKLAQSGKQPTVEGMQEKRVLSDGTRVLELHVLQGNQHHDGLIVAYLPKEKFLIEADAYTPAAPNTPPPAQPNPFSVNLHSNLERLKLDVEQILPLHGRQVPLVELLKAIGKTS